MTKFDECILHIGTEKTGTSTLQLLFHKNRKNLSKKSIFFPETFGEKSHRLLTAFASANHKIDNIRKDLGLINLNLIESFRQKIAESFKNEIKNENCKKLLLSGEHMHSRLTTVEEINFLKNFLDNYVDKYKILVYIRPQHEMAVSLFSTLCKVGRIGMPILPEVNQNNLFYNHEKLLDRWATVFGSENILPRIFAREDFPDGDVKKDFCHILGLDWDDFDDVKNVNDSINSDAQRFLWEINKFLPSFIDKKPNKYRGNISQLVTLNRIGPGLLPSHKQAESFFNIFAKSNESVRKKWFPERKELFQIDFSKYPDKSADLQMDYTLAFKIFAEIWMMKQKQVLSLKAYNETTK